MLSIFDVVFEKANFKQAFQGVISKLQRQNLDKASKISLDYYSRVHKYGEICLRVAIRVIHLYSNYPEAAYGDLVYNAIQMEDDERAEEISKNISVENEEATIIALIQLTVLYAKYDRGYFTNGELCPDFSSIPRECVDFTKLLVKKIQEFEKKYNFVPLEECQFDGAYNDIISRGYCGMPTYLIDNTIWVFNLDRGAKWGVILFLIAYVMGRHSHIDAYKKVSRLGIVNILGGYTESIYINEISDVTFSAVCRNYIGYDTPRAAKDWVYSSGNNKDRIESAIQYHKFYMPDLDMKDLKPEVYKDGIYEISYSEYWAYYEKNVDPYATMPTKPAYIELIYMLKREEYLMFVAKGKQNLYILQGGKFKNLDFYEMNYYYDNLKEYGDRIRNMFSKYWDTVDKIAGFVKELEIPSPFAKSGNIHGCIIDIDFYNHIYVNPYDGKITPYFAIDRSSREVYKNLVSLIEEKRPECLDKLRELCEDDKYKLITSENEKEFSIALTSSEVKMCKQISYEEGIYDVSRLMKLFQKAHDAKLICVWANSILITSDKLIGEN